jgi:hypothetical protein
MHACVHVWSCGPCQQSRVPLGLWHVTVLQNALWQFPSTLKNRIIKYNCELTFLYVQSNLNLIFFYCTCWSDTGLLHGWINRWATYWKWWPFVGNFCCSGRRRSRNSGDRILHSVPFLSLSRQHKVEDQSGVSTDPVMCRNSSWWSLINPSKLGSIWIWIPHTSQFWGRPWALQYLHKLQLRNY